MRVRWNKLIKCVCSVCMESWSVFSHMSHLFEVIGITEACLFLWCSTLALNRSVHSKLYVAFGHTNISPWLYLINLAAFFSAETTVHLAENNLDNQPTKCLINCFSQLSSVQLLNMKICCFSLCYFWGCWQLLTKVLLISLYLLSCASNITCMYCILYMFLSHSNPFILWILM